MGELPFYQQISKIMQDIGGKKGNLKFILPYETKNGELAEHVHQVIGGNSGKQ